MSLKQLCQAQAGNCHPLAVELVISAIVVRGDSGSWWIERRGQLLGRKWGVEVLSGEAWPWDRGRTNKSGLWGQEAEREWQRPLPNTEKFRRFSLLLRYNSTEGSMNEPWKPRSSRNSSFSSCIAWVVNMNVLKTIPKKKERKKKNLFFSWLSWSIHAITKYFKFGNL
jgi:hypothetical protein